MSVESLGDYLGSSSKKSLQRIFVSHQLEKAIIKDIGEQVTVIVRTNEVIIRCQSAAQASFLGQKKRQLHVLISRYHGPNQPTLKIKAGSQGP